MYVYDLRCVSAPEQVQRRNTFTSIQTRANCCRIGDTAHVLLHQPNVLRCHAAVG